MTTFRLLPLLALVFALAACGEEAPIAQELRQKIVDKLATMNCEADATEVEREGDGFEVEADCPDGEFEATLNADLAIASLERD